MDVNAGIRFTSLRHGPCGLSSRGSGTISWMAIIAAILWFQILDLVSTKLVIDHGGIELNPIFVPFWGSTWFWPVMTLAKIGFLGWLYYALTISDRYYPKAALVTGGIIVLQSALVVMNNFHVLIHL